MKEMVNLALKTGFSMKQTYGHIGDIFNYENGTGVVGVADSASVFGFYYMEKLIAGKSVKVGQDVEERDVKAIYGVRLNVVEDGAEKVKPRGQFGPEYIFLAKDQQGVKELYNLVKINYDNFYYRGQISLSDVKQLSESVVVIAMDCEKLNRIDYIGIDQRTPRYLVEAAREHEIPMVAINTNWYPTEDDHATYELMVGPRFSERQTYPQHVMSTDEWCEHQRFRGSLAKIQIVDCIDNTHVIADQIEKYDLPRAPMIKAKTKKTLEYICKIGAKNRGINIKDPGIYKDRYEREMKLINERGFQDYFLVVADMIAKAKKKYLIGPGRGSAAGSLVCYLTGITEVVEPIEYDLLFERFIDETRFDLPDIDIDFPDKHRKKVIAQLIKDYGEDHVKHIANVSTFKPKSAITEFAKGLRIPIGDVETLKDAIIERSGGDARAAQCMADTFEETEAGRHFIEKYPAMELVSPVESHPSHTSVHAAGIIVCNDPVHWYAGTNARDNTAMVDKKSSEYLNLLKIDVLGLRTLSILEDCAKMLGWKHTKYYDLPLDDKGVFELINEGRTAGIFQFEGHSLKTLSEKMDVENFNDLTAITSLARPGALYSGGAGRYVKYRNGEELPIYFGEEHENITGSTYGIVVYQEQILNMCRRIGNMTWADVNALRVALSKSFGKEYFMKYKNKFLEGCKENGYSPQDGEFLWGEIEHGGNYAFNKSHADSYAVISYWTAYMKANHIKEFVVANLRNAKDDESAVKILRDAVENDGVEYVSIDPDESGVDWGINSSGIIMGGLTNIAGIGVKKANEIIKMRGGEKKFTPSISKKLFNPNTIFDILWPVKHFFGSIYENPSKYGLSSSPKLIKDVRDHGEHVFIGQLKSKNIRDLNEYINVAKRGGEIFKTHTKEFTMKLEDDTDSIMVSIGRFDYDKMDAQDIAETGKVDDDYYMIKGKIHGEGRYVRAIMFIKLDKYDYGVEVGDQV